MNELMTAPTTDEIIRNAQYHQAQRVAESSGVTAFQGTYHPRRVRENHRHQPYDVSPFS